MIMEPKVKSDAAEEKKKSLKGGKKSQAKKTKKDDSINVFEVLNFSICFSVTFRLISSKNEWASWRSR